MLTTPRTDPGPRKAQVQALDLDQAAAPLRTVLGDLSARLAGEIQTLMARADGLRAEDLVALLSDVLPVMADPVCAAATEFALAWYESLAPGIRYEPEPPAGHGMPDPAQLAATGGWAVRAAGEATPVERLTGAATRWVHDAARTTVSHNASREGVRYLRHAAAGACAFCRLGASRGAVFKSAASAIRGHDHCHCIAVPVRPGTRLELPDRYARWSADYDRAAAELRANGSPVDLRSVLAVMRVTDDG